MDKKEKTNTSKTIKNVKKKKQTKPKKKAFTLIELLAVIIILGVIMLIAIPSVTRYINDSRKKTYIDTARQYIKGATTLVNSGELEVYDTGVTYYIPNSCIELESGGNSPFGEFDSAYIIVTYDNKTYNYYWISRDTSGQGINKVTSSYDLDSKLIKAGVTKEEVDVKYSVGGRNNLMLLDDDGCRTFEQKEISESDIVSLTDDGNLVPSVVEYPEGKDKETVEIGNIVKIGTEDFYVVKRDGTDLMLLSRYNLKVGNIFQGNGSKIGEYHTTDEGYGIQSSEAKGFDGYQTRYGTINFSSSNYWKGKVGTEYPGIYCTNDEQSAGTECANVFNSNSNLYSYVQTYKTTLEEMGAHIKQIRLLRTDEIISLGCVRGQMISCFNAPNFIIETTYWLETVNSDNHITCVHNDGYVYYNLYGNIEDCGIRPLIVI